MSKDKQKYKRPMALSLAAGYPVGWRNEYPYMSKTPNLMFTIDCLMGADPDEPATPEKVVTGGISFVWEGQKDCVADKIIIEYKIYSTKPTILLDGEDEPYEGVYDTIDYHEYGTFDIPEATVETWVTRWANYKKDVLGRTGNQQFEADFFFYTSRNGTKSSHAATAAVSVQLNIDVLTAE